VKREKQREETRLEGELREQTTYHTETRDSS